MNPEPIWCDTRVSAVVDECGCTVVATSEQYLELELALHVCYVEDEGPSRYDVLRDEMPGPTPFTPWSAA